MTVQIVESVQQVEIVRLGWLCKTALLVQLVATIRLICQTVQVVRTSLG